MNTNLTEIIFLIDESGSMFSIKEDTIGGFNSFIEDQRNNDGDAHITLVKFSNTHSYVYDAAGLNEVRKMTSADYTPGGCTALLDAIGDTMNEVGKRLSDTPEDQRPGKVIFIITTDGYENASYRFNKSQIKEMIEHQRTKYSWEFMFIGADIDSVSEAVSLGISANMAADYSKTSIGTEALYSAISCSVKGYRSTGTIADNWSDGLKVNDTSAQSASTSLN